MLWLIAAITCNLVSKYPIFLSKILTNSFAIVAAVYFITQPWSHSKLKQSVQAVYLLRHFSVDWLLLMNRLTLMLLPMEIDIFPSQICCKITIHALKSDYREKQSELNISRYKLWNKTRISFFYRFMYYHMLVLNKMFSIF